MLRMKKQHDSADGHGGMFTKLMRKNTQLHYRNDKSIALLRPEPVSLPVPPHIKTIQDSQLVPQKKIKKTVKVYENRGFVFTKVVEEVVSDTATPQNSLLNTVSTSTSASGSASHTDSTVSSHYENCDNESKRSKGKKNNNTSSTSGQHSLFKNPFLKASSKKHELPNPLPTERTTSSVINLGDDATGLSSPIYKPETVPEEKPAETRHFPTGEASSQGKRVLIAEQLMRELDLRFSLSECNLIRWCWSENSQHVNAAHLYENGYASRTVTANGGSYDTGPNVPSFSFTFRSEHFWIIVHENVHRVSSEFAELLPPIPHLQIAFASIIRMMVVNIDNLASMKEYFFRLGRMHERIFNSSNAVYNVLGDAINCALADTYKDFYSTDIEEVWMALYSYMAACMLVCCETDQFLPNANIKIKDTKVPF